MPPDVHVYAPPRVVESPPAAPPTSRDVARHRSRALALLGVSVLVLLGGGVLAAGLDAPSALLLAGVAAVLVALAGAGSAVLSLVTSARAASRPSLGATLISVSAVVANLGMAGVGALTALLSTMTFTRGRQVRRLGKVLLPPVAPSDAWASADGGDGEIDLGEVLAGEEIGAGVRAELAAQWRENGRTEHASVAAFARLTLDLVALGAPPALVAAAQRDALDEIRHAELCFSLARAIDGKSEGPGPFPAAARARTVSRVRSVALAELAVDSLVDGALHEGVSARIVARLARRAVDPTIRAILRDIARDEGRHSAHGWDVVRFCLAEGGAPVAHALASAARMLPARMTTELPPDAAAGGWERWGIMGSALEAAEYQDARASVARRVSELVAPYGVAAVAMRHSSSRPSAAIQRST